jgi:hypothetical protein
LEHNAAVYRRRDALPKAIGKLGRPPAYFDKIEKKLWKELVRDAPVRWGAADKWLLEVTVHLLVKLRSRTLDGQERTQLHQYMKSLGLIPALREAVKEGEKVKSDWDEL